MRDDKATARALTADTRRDDREGRKSTPRLGDRLASAVLKRLIGHDLRGRLEVVLPGGQVAALGDGERGLRARIILRSHGAVWRLLSRGLIGFGESYMAGEIDSDDLGAVMQLYLANSERLPRLTRSLLRPRTSDRRVHNERRNTIDGSRRNIAAHYDLGNAFYGQWLDASMSYSSGIFAAGCGSLEAAQVAKIERIAELLAIEPGARVLEIGCGWGALAQRCAEAGAQVTALTISPAQFEAARSRISDAGLDDKAQVALTDYRDARGTFDRLVSVEMVEAVGEENWGRYFGVLHDRLRPGGHGILQAITIAESAFADYRKEPDFIQRYIFPGGMLPSVEAMRAHATAVGLRFETVERFGASYAATLAEWRQRFVDAWPRIAALGFDDRFRRMWEYYLIYCEAGFRHGLIDVGLYRVTRPA